MTVSRPARDVESTPSTYRAETLLRGLRVMEELAAAGAPSTLVDLHRNTSLPKSTLVRLLSVLDAAGYVSRTGQAYWLGPAVLPLAEAYTDALDVSTTAEPTLRALAAQTGQTANLGILDGAEVVHLCVVEPDRQLRFRSTAGARDNAHSTGLGKLLLAHLDAEALPRHLPAEPFPAPTKRTVTTREALERQFPTVRRQRYALDAGEGDLGVHCLAVPLPHGTQTVAAISLSGAAGEIDASRKLFLEALWQASDALASDARFQRALRLAIDSVQR